GRLRVIRLGRTLPRLERNVPSTRPFLWSLSMPLPAQQRQTFRRPMPRRRNPRPSPFPQRSPRSRSAILGDLLVQALELGGALELGLLALGPARGDGA